MGDSRSLFDFTSVLTGRQGHTGRVPHDDDGRDRSDVTSRQRMSKLQQEQGRKESPVSQSWEVTHRQSETCGVWLCYSSHRELTWGPFFLGLSLVF